MSSVTHMEGGHCIRIRLLLQVVLQGKKEPHNKFFPPSLCSSPVISFDTLTSPLLMCHVPFRWKQLANKRQAPIHVHTWLTGCAAILAHFSKQRWNSTRRRGQRYSSPLNTCSRCLSATLSFAGDVCAGRRLWCSGQWVKSLLSCLTSFYVQPKKFLHTFNIAANCCATPPDPFR